MDLYGRLARGENASEAHSNYRRETEGDRQVKKNLAVIQLDTAKHWKSDRGIRSDFVPPSRENINKDGFQL